MVDGSDLRLSELYFAVLQILRIATEWINESINDLRRMIDDIERLYFAPNLNGNQHATFLPQTSNSARDAAIEVFKLNWDRVISHQRTLGDALLTRIAKRRNEVNILREGVSQISFYLPTSRCSQRLPPSC